jgi:phage gp29-like protein
MSDDFLSLFTNNVDALCEGVKKVTGWVDDKLRVFTHNNEDNVYANQEISNAIAE